MRVCVIGAGLAGALLAWRVGSDHPGVEVELLVGAVPVGDDAGPGAGSAWSGSEATEVSGGLVRGFETDPQVCRLAAASLAELRDDAALSEWAGYRETGSVYICAVHDREQVASQVEDVQRELPGSARVTGSGELRAHGWTGLPEECVAVVERHAGFFSPARLRRSVLTDLGRLAVRVVPVEVDEVRPEPDGGASARVGDAWWTYDAVVVAVGRWTGRFLARSGLPADGYRTKLIQYAVHPSGGWRPPAFVDDLTGLYGRSVPGDRVLLGVGTDHWDVDPDDPAPDPALTERARTLADERFPTHLAPAERVVTAADCYTSPAGLALRPVLDDTYRLYTFTGGSGGAAKTVLAASRLAADELVALVSPPAASASLAAAVPPAPPASPPVSVPPASDAPPSAVDAPASDAPPSAVDAPAAPVATASPDEPGSPPDASPAPVASASPPPPAVPPPAVPPPAVPPPAVPPPPTAAESPRGGPTR